MVPSMRWVVCHVPIGGPPLPVGGPPLPVGGPPFAVEGPPFPVEGLPIFRLETCHYSVGGLPTLAGSLPLARQRFARYVTGLTQLAASGDPIRAVRFFATEY